MIIIANIDKNRGIGYNGNLLVSIKEDMIFFKKQTENNVVIMGKNTLFSFKNKKPLKNRINIIFTKDKNIKNDYKKFNNIVFVNNINELFTELKNYKNMKHFVIGGEKIYNLLIKYCDILLLTKVDETFLADTFFPDYEQLGFKLISKSNDKYYNQIKYNFTKYIKGNKKYE